MLDPGFHDVPKGHVATIVTHLEMTSPPVSPEPVAFPEGVRLERQMQVDLAIYRDLFRRVGGLPWLWWTRLTLSDTALGAVLGDPAVHLYYVIFEGRPEGILELDFRDASFCEIAYFGLTPALVGTGTGGALMRAAIALGFEAKAPRLYLHTCTLDSPQALGFYRHMGFVPFKQEVEIAADPRLIGVLPKEAGPTTPIFLE